MEYAYIRKTVKMEIFSAYEQGEEDMEISGVADTLFTAYKKIEEQKTDASENEESSSSIATKTGVLRNTTNYATPGDELVSKLSSVSDVLERLGYSGRVTATAIDSQKEKLEKAFEAQVKSDLKELGVDENIDFRVALDQAGNFVINTDSEDKAKVEAYFKENPGYAQVLKDIETLSNAKRQTGSGLVNMTDLRKTLQTQYIGNFFLDSDGTNGFATNTLSFSNGIMQSFLGISKIV